MLVMPHTLKEISQAKETLIFLLQNLGFVINLKKFATNTNEGNIIFGDSDKFSKHDISLTSVRETNSYQTKIKLRQQSLAELKWWKESLLLQNGKPLKMGMPQLIIRKEASKTCWRAVCQRTTTRETWSYQEMTKHINVLELIAVKLAILTFTRRKSITPIYLQIDNITALSYLVKLGGTRSQQLLQASKKIWDYLLANQIAVTAEYLQSTSGRLATQKSWRFKRLEIESQNIFLDCGSQRNTSNRPIFFPTEPSVTKTYVLKSGPRELWSRFHSALLEKPSILLNR